ncbi:MAG: serine/threonine-protein kinase [Kofleriaceae bacterium]
MLRRFDLASVLGQGSHGVVYEALDRETGATVAVKVFRGDYDPSRIRREIAALRLLRVRGVVKFLDEGTADGAPYIAMERVDGSDFPAAPKPTPWETLAPTVIALFETLAIVHNAGIVHRDLKPGNVLVDSHGRPTLVDFGVSWRAGYRGHTVEGQIVGTPQYLAPEQIRGESVGPATDLYAAGVMIYEALTGALPHQADSMPALFYKRLHEAPTPLLEAAPGTPPAVARVIDQLLQVSHLDRPRSADFVVALLTEQTCADELALPRLGVRVPEAEVMSALSLGVSAVIVGPPGSGRTFVLERAQRRCADEGRPTVALVSGRTPYASLAPLFPELLEQDLGLEELDELAERQVIEAISGGLVIFADDVERCDPRTQRLLERVADLGNLVCGRLATAVAPRPRRAPTRPVNEAASIFLPDLEEHELRELFLGGDRVFHVRADAARILHELTGGRVARVVSELRRWVRMGVARWHADRLSVEPALIDEFDARPAPGGVVLDVVVPPHLIELVGWLTLCVSGVEPAVLATAMQRKRFEVEGLLVELEQLGVARRRGELVQATGHVRHAEVWPPEQRLASHRALAATLPPGDPRRLLHLLGGTEPTSPALPSVIAEEAVALARRSVREGKLARAVTWLADSVVAIRQGDDVGAAVRVVAEWVRVAVLFRTASALDHVLTELERLPVTPLVANLRRLAHAALAVLTTGGRESMTLAEQIEPFDDPELELERFATRVNAARTTELEAEQHLVALSSTWALARGDREAQARAVAWLGRLRYAESEFAEAARLHHQAAELTTVTSVAVDALLDAASAEMEDLDVAAASRDAERARRSAAVNRNALQEARAEWLLRALAYREGRATAVDEELRALVAEVGSPNLEMLLTFTEAAIAYRLGQLATARRLAVAAAHGWRDLRRSTPRAIASALAIACGEAATDAELEELVTSARDAADPVLAIQILALAVSGAPALKPRVSALATRLAQSISPRYLRARSDVLSPEEAIALLLD